MGEDRRSNIGGYPLDRDRDGEEAGTEETLPERMRELRTRTLRDRETTSKPPDRDRGAERGEAADSEPQREEGEEGEEER